MRNRVKPAEAAAAPATVSGSSAPPICHWETGKARDGQGAVSQETGRRVTLTFRRWDGEGDATMLSSPASTILTSGISARLWPALAAVLFGLVLFAGAGFASPDVLHSATHDVRHALGLPCH